MPNELTIRFMTIADVDALKPLTKSMHAELVGDGSIPLIWRWDWLRKRFVDLLSIPTGIGLVLVDDDGAIHGVIIGCVYDAPQLGLRTLNEFLWYVKPESRKSSLFLMEAFEETGRKHGAEVMTVGHQIRGRTAAMSRFYGRLGLVPHYVDYIKSLDKE